MVMGAILFKWPILAERAGGVNDSAREVPPVALEDNFSGGQVSERVEGDRVEEKASEQWTVTLLITGANGDGQRVSKNSVNPLSPGGERGFSTLYEVQVSENDTVTKVMEQAKEDGVISYSAVDYGGSLGLFFEEINGLKNNQAPNYYWQLYVNGEKSRVGASAARVTAGDRVEWRYEEMEEL